MGKLHLPSEWSKLLTVLVLIPYGLVIMAGLFLLAILILRGQYEPVVNLFLGLIGFVATPLGIAYAFYFWKSKAENLVKCAKELKQSGISDEVTGEIINKE